MAAEGGFPAIRSMGLTGLLVSFADRLSEPANRAALAYRAAVEGENWPGVEETSTSLASVFLRFDPLSMAPGDLRARLDALLASRDWFSAPLPSNRRRWRIPTVYGTDLAPQLGGNTHTDVPAATGDLHAGQAAIGDQRPVERLLVTGLDASVLSPDFVGVIHFARHGRLAVLECQVLVNEQRRMGGNAVVGIGRLVDHGLNDVLNTRERLGEVVHT